jgi:nucleotide-binding universal stress UspA family protein
MTVTGAQTARADRRAALEGSGAILSRRRALDRRQGRKDEESKMKHILLAYDGGEPAKRALETAIDLTKRFDASLSVVSVVPTHPGRWPVDPWDDRSVHAQELLEARKLLEEQGIKAEMIEPAGDPAKEIEKIASAGKFDTIVIGSRGLGSLGRILQGSVSEHVAANAAATVVVAR